VSSTVFPESFGANSRARSGKAFNGTENITTSPNVTASAGVPADARVPSRSVSARHVSGCLEATRTSWLASTHNFASVDPIIPAPMTAIRVAASFLGRAFLIQNLAPSTILSNDREARSSNTRAERFLGAVDSRAGTCVVPDKEMGRFHAPPYRQGDNRLEGRRRGVGELRPTIPLNSAKKKISSLPTDR